MKSTQAPQKDGPRINREIRVREVQLIHAEGHNRGIVEILEAQKLADDAGSDLVEIVPTANPPVCKILDYGKFRFLDRRRLPRPQEAEDRRDQGNQAPSGHR